MPFAGKVAIITGGTRGIGASCAKMLAARGAKVVVSYLSNADRADKFVAEIQAEGGEANALQADVRSTDQINRLVEQAVEIHGHIDIAVSNAPAGWVESSLREIAWEEYRAVVTGELKAAFDLTRAVLPIMSARRFGRLIYMASSLAGHPMPGALASGTAKAALIAFMRYVAHEAGADGITANAVAPALVETEMNQYMPDDEKARVAAATPLKRIAMPDDIAGVVAFLASDDSRFLTGNCIPVNGGLEMD